MFGDAASMGRFLLNPILDLEKFREGDLQLPPRPILAAMGVVLTSTMSLYCIDFQVRKRKQHNKRKRIFGRMVRAYLSEFKSEVHQVKSKEFVKEAGGSFFGNPVQAQSSQDQLTICSPTAELAEFYNITNGIVPLTPFTPGEDFSESHYRKWIQRQQSYETKTVTVYGGLPTEPTRRRRLCVLQGSEDEHVKAAVAKALRLPKDEPLTVSKAGLVIPVLNYESLEDGATYEVRLEHNPRRRRLTMIMQATAPDSRFRFSVGVDWKEVKNMLRKAVEWEEDTEVIHELQGLLARHLLERLHDFSSDPNKDKYVIGKGVDEMDRDLTSLSELLRCSREAVVAGWGEEGQKNPAELVRCLDQHIHKRYREGWKNVGKLLFRSYVTAGNISSNLVAWVLTALAGFLQPCVSTLQTRFEKTLIGVRQTDDLQSLSCWGVLFWLLVVSMTQSLLDKASESIHTYQSLVTVQVLRRSCAQKMARADQVFLDAHDVEDILASLESDLSAIELLIRKARGWLLTASRIIGCMYISVQYCTKPNGFAVVIGGIGGVVACKLIRSLKVFICHLIDNIPEEEDETVEFSVGAKVRYQGGGAYAGDVVLPNGATLEVGDVGTVVRLDDEATLPLVCKFPSGEIGMGLEDVAAMDQMTSMSLLGGPAVDYEEVWEEEYFKSARLWGKEVQEVDEALAVKDLQIRKQSEFVLPTRLVQEFSDVAHNSLPQVLMLVMAYVLMKYWYQQSIRPGIMTQIMVLKEEVSVGWDDSVRTRMELRGLLKDSFIGAQRTLHLLDYKPTIDIGTGLSPSLDSIKGYIEFRDVHFHYPSAPHKPVLNGATFRIPEGSHTAIVGPSGCGKTSILNLLIRLYDPTHGQVLLDGTPLNKYDVRWLRGKVVGIAAQEPHLFDGTLQYNVKYSRPAASREEVKEALEAAGAWQFVQRMPEKLLSLVGHGSRVSGGEKKRIGLARTLLARPRVLLLDEPTAGLDAPTERSIRDGLKAWASKYNVTIITVSHRLSFIQDCDQILVVGDPDRLDDDPAYRQGTIVAQGNHEELLRKSPLYQDLVNSSQVRAAAETESCSGASVENE